MSPLLSLLLAAGIIVVGTGLVLAWNRWTTSRQEDGISAFAREMQALAPDRPIGVDGVDPDERVTEPNDGPTSDGPAVDRPGPEA
ncbi:MAG: hypothetical protein AAFZ07_28155 [Actinomycetota bacterium]